MIVLIKSVAPHYDQWFEVQSFCKIIKFLQGNDVGKCDSWQNFQSVQWSYAQVY